MKSYKVTLQRSGEPVDLLVSVDPTVTVGALADALTARVQPNTAADRDDRPDAGTGWAPLGAAGRHGLPQAGPQTLAISGPDGSHTLAANDAVERSGLRSGLTVAVTVASEHYPNPTPNAHAAVLTVTAGDDRHLGPIWLPAGTSTIGRDPGCTVVLSDPLISKVHARVNVTDTVEIVDNASTNGTSIGGTPITRARLRPGQTAQLGDTQISIDMHDTTSGMSTVPLGGSGWASGGFNRSPRVDPPYPGTVFEGPEPPKRPQRHRFPTIALIAPLIVGGLLFLFTRSVLSLMFVALSPLMLVGTFAENTFVDRKAFKDALIEFRSALAALNSSLHAASDAERVGRQREHPSSAEMVEAGHRRSALLWTRRPEHASFLQLRLGLGRLPSRHSVELPTKTEAIPALWAELTRVTEAYSTVDRVPIAADLRESGALGIAGYDRSGVPIAWSVIAQLVTLHSPAELILAAVTSAATARDWAWLKWLPHTSVHPVSAHTPLRGPHLAADAGAATTLIAEIDDVIDVRSATAKGSGSATQPPLPVIVLLVEDDADTDRGRLVDIAERGAPVGVYVIWVASTVEDLPSVCRTYVEAERGTGTGPVGYVHRGATVDPVALEPLTLTEVETLARALAPVVDIGARTNDDSGLPLSVAFVDLAGSQVDRSVTEVIERWQESGSLRGDAHRAGSDPGLRALIGVRGVDAVGQLEPMYLDLRRDGPHALVGGTTGAGKSELLQSWILGMATALSPRRVTFLFVDYKGGAAFGDCMALPHAVGLVTDLSLRQVHRALTSLRAEVTYRETVLHDYGVKDLTDLEQSRADIAPPRLVIVVDEFAALRAEVPEFVDGVVDVAARGRSLGLHLILATQRPAGIITDALRANTNLRVALRMADDTDSTDVLGSAIAGSFDPDTPGRAVVKNGPGRLVTFQAAYAGGWSNGDPQPPLIVVESLGFGRRLWADPNPPIRESQADRGPNDVSRIVRTVRSAAEAVGLPRPRLPWQPELPVVVELGQLLERVPREAHDMRRQVDSTGSETLVEETPRTRVPIPLGRRDQPRLQIAPPAAFYPDRDGNLLVYGTSGSGKSTALRTVALSALLDKSHPAHVYGIETGGRGLSMLEPLPQTGAIVRIEDTARVVRLLAFLKDQIEARQIQFAGLQVGTLAEYWQRTGDLATPRILLLIDGVGAFTSRYPAGTTDGVFEDLLTIANEGRAVGVHVVASAERGNAVTGSLASAMLQRLYLRMASENDYGMVGLRADSIPSDAPAGRGLFGGEDIQVAVLGGVDQVAQHAAITALAAGSTQVAPARPIEVLGKRVALSDLPDHDRDLPVFGRSAALEAVTFPSRGTFVVTGPPDTGRTTAVRTLVEAMVRWRPAARLYYIGAQPGSVLATKDGWVEKATGLAEAADLAGKLAASMPMPMVTEPVMVVVESVERLFNPQLASIPDIENQQRMLVAMLEAFVAAGHLVVLEGDPPALMRSTMAFAHGRRTGLLLCPTSDHGSALGVTVPRGTNQNDFPKGRGIVFHAGVPTVVQVAVTD